MNSRALTLQSRPEQVKRIYRTGAKCATKRADACGGEVREGGIVDGKVVEAGFSRCDELFEVLEGGEVDGAVGEHADEAHGKTTVEGAETGGRPHFAGGGEDEGVAVGAAGDGFVLDAAVGEY